MTGATSYRGNCSPKREEYIWNKWKLPQFRCTRV